MSETTKSKERLEVLERIKANELLGGEAFFNDVENDPPFRSLEVGEVDYLNKTLKKKFQRMIAYQMGQKMRREHNKLNQITVYGKENLEGIKGGAIITSNHFGFFESACASKVKNLLNKKKRLYIVIREGNYFMPNPYGFLFRNCDTLPLSNNPGVMKEFSIALTEVLKRGHYVLIYPEQSMWWNYRKPRPQRSGAAHFSVKNNVPIIPCFVTMEDLEKIDNDGFPVQKYNVHVMKPLYPDPNLSLKENVKIMTEKNYEMCKAKYEEVYQKPLVYGESDEVL